MEGKKWQVMCWEQPRSFCKEELGVNGDITLISERVLFKNVSTSLLNPFLYLILFVEFGIFPASLEKKCYFFPLFALSFLYALFAFLFLSDCQFFTHVSLLK